MAINQPLTPEQQEALRHQLEAEMSRSNIEKPQEAHVFRPDSAGSELARAVEAKPLEAVAGPDPLAKVTEEDGMGPIQLEKLKASPIGWLEDSIRNPNLLDPNDAILGLQELDKRNRNQKT